MSKPTVTKADILAGLRQLGLVGGEVVMVHSSLSRFGLVVGGAPTVIAALREAIGPEGTLVMSAITITPTFTEAHVRAGLAGRANYECPEVFDVQKTPTWAGAIPETFRAMPGVVRSWHPTHSVAALGPMAEELTAKHHLKPSCGLDTPYERITRLEAGRTLLLGVSHESNTTMHTFEELTGHEYMLHPFLCRIPFRSPRGDELAVTTLHRWHIPRELGRLESRYIDAGAQTVARIGSAPIRLCNAKGLREITLEALKRDPFALCTPAGRLAWDTMKATGNLIDPPVL